MKTKTITFSDLAQMTSEERLTLFRYDKNENIKLKVKRYHLWELYYFNDMQTHKLCETHKKQTELFFDILEGRETSAMFIGSKDMGKTARRLPFVVRFLLEGEIKAYLRISFMRKNANNFVDEMFNRFISDVIVQDYGDLLDQEFIESELKTRNKKKKLKRSGRFDLTNGSSVDSVGSNESISGIWVGGKRPTDIDFDDYENKETIESELKTGKVLSRMREAKSSAGTITRITYQTNFYDSTHSNSLKLIYENKGMPVLWFKYTDWTGRVVWDKKEADKRNEEIKKIGLPREYYYVSCEEKIGEIGEEEFYQFFLNDITKRKDNLLFIDETAIKPYKKMMADKWKIYEEPKDSTTYIAGIDTGAGINENGTTCCLREKGGNVVAVYFSNDTSITDSAQEIIEGCQKYKVQYAIERNGIGQGMVDRFLNEPDLSNATIITEKTQKKTGTQYENRFGIHTTSGKIDVAIDGLKDMLQKEEILLRDEELIKELRSMTYRKFKESQNIGGSRLHFDRAMALFLTFIGEKCINSNGILIRMI